MTTLIVGPSNAGKSTFISRRNLEPITYAHELKSREVPPRGALHYNLLHHAAMASEPSETLISSEPLLKKVLGSTRIRSAIVIVAPMLELMERAASRRVVEPMLADPGVYDGNFWSSILAKVDLFAIYERLFDLLDAYRICYSVFYSSAAMPDFLPSDRVYVHHNLRSRYISPPTLEDVCAVARMPGMEYQRVELPHGRATSSSGFEHVGAGRGGTFEICRDRSLRGRSVLDIGCALGDFLFRYERHGAERLYGLEPKRQRFSAAKSLGTLLNSRAEFHHLDLASVDLNEPFDDVLALNVLHHVSDIQSFVGKAALLAKQRLVIEYPTLEDPKFQALSGPIDAACLSALPLVGVSSKSADQNFVFTASAIERLVQDAGDFRVSIQPSPIPAREIAICTRH